MGHTRTDTSSIMLMSILSVTGLGVIIDAVVIFALPTTVNTNPFVMSILNAFAGGVFVVIGLGHILIEAREDLAVGWPEFSDLYLIADMLALFGYTVMLALQRVLLAGINKQRDKSSTSSQSQSSVGCFCLTWDERVHAATSVVMPSECVHGFGGDCVDCLEALSAMQCPVIAPQPFVYPATSATLCMHSSSSTVTKKDVGIAIDQKGAVSDNGREKGQMQAPEEKSDERNKLELMNLGAIFLMFMVHGIFAGLALGLQETKDGAMAMFAAIIGHHWAGDLIFSLSTGEPSSLRPRKVIRFGLAVFVTCNVAIGICIAWGLMEQDISRAVTGSLSAITAGTFLFFGFTDIVPSAMPKNADRRCWQQMLAFLAGAVIIYILLIALREPED